MAVKKVQVGARVLEDLHEKMKAIAQEKGISVSEAYAEAARDYVTKGDQPTPEEEARMIAMYLAKEMAKRYPSIP